MWRLNATYTALKGIGKMQKGGVNLIIFYSPWRLFHPFLHVEQNATTTPEGGIVSGTFPNQGMGWKCGGNSFFCSKYQSHKTEKNMFFFVKISNKNRIYSQNPNPSLDLTGSKIMRKYSLYHTCQGSFDLIFSANLQIIPVFCSNVKYFDNININNFQSMKASTTFVKVYNKIIFPMSYLDVIKLSFKILGTFLIEKIIKFHKSLIL